MCELVKSQQRDEAQKCDQPIRQLLVEIKIIPSHDERLNGHRVS